MEFYVVVGRYEKDDEIKEWNQSVYFEYEKAKDQCIVNDMAGISNGKIEWRVDTYQGQIKE